MRHFSLIKGLLVGACALPLSSVCAQTMFQPEPLTHFREVDPVVTGTITLPVTTSPAKPEVRLPAPTKPQTLLRYLPNNAQGLRISGEIGASEWPVYFTKSQLSQPVKFQLGYLSAVSDLPEASKLSIQINDVVIGEITVDATHKVKTALFDVPAELLMTGFNSLRIIANHRHRVDCSLSATYELWTQIDSTQTGFLVSGEGLFASSIAEIPALAPSPQGGFPVRAMLGGSTNATAINMISRMAQAVVMRGRFEQPLVDVASSMGTGPGINLAAGLHADLVKLGGLERLAPPEGPVLEFMPATATQRATLVASGRNKEEIDSALEEFAVLPTSIGSPQGLRAARAFPGYRVEGGTRLKLSDLGVISQDFSGHLFRSTLNIVMPPDFYPADYAKFTLELAGGYAPGLAPGAQIVISINSKIAVGSALAKSSGEVFKGRNIDLPLGMLRPGLNKLEIDAHLPMPEDASCNPTAKGADKKRFLLLDETALVLPSLARVAVSPNLAITAAGGFPFAGSTLNSHLYIPSPDPDTIAAAVTLIARMSLSAGTSIDFNVSTTVPPLDDGSTLVVAAAPSLSPAALAIGGLDADAISRTWKPKIAAVKSAEESQALTKYEALNQARVALQRNFPAECRMRDLRARNRQTTGTGGPGKAAPTAVPLARVVNQSAKPAGLAEQWTQSVNGQSNWVNWSYVTRLPEVASNVAGRGWDWIITQVSWGRDTISLSVQGKEKSVITENASLLLSQKNHGNAGEGIWTIVTAATPAELKQNIFCLVDPRVWSQVGGGMAALDVSEALVTTTAAVDPRFISTQALSFSNVRLIAAGWLSLNRWMFVLLVLAMAMALSVATLAFVRNIGRPS